MSEDDIKISNWEMVFWALSFIDASGSEMANTSPDRLVADVAKLIEFAADDFEKKSHILHMTGPLASTDASIRRAQELYDRLNKYVESL